MIKVKHYKPNVVYILLIDGTLYYVGCHTRKCRYLREKEIILDSGNSLRLQAQSHRISTYEYYSRVKLISVFECDSKDEALELEKKKIIEFMKAYGSNCLNKQIGNGTGLKGLKQSEESRKKVSVAKRKGVLQFSKDDEFIAEYPSLMEAMEKTGCSQSSICQCCKGKLKSAGGYVWRYAS